MIDPRKIAKLINEEAPDTLMPGTDPIDLDDVKSDGGLPDYNMDDEIPSPPPEIQPEISSEKIERKKGENAALSKKIEEIGDNSDAEIAAETEEMNNLQTAQNTEQTELAKSILDVKRAEEAAKKAQEEKQRAQAALEALTGGTKKPEEILAAKVAGETIENLPIPEWKTKLKDTLTEEFNKPNFK